MAEYTVVDNQTGKEITFDWHDSKPPTQQDMLAVFAEANRQSQPKPIQNPQTDQKIMGTEAPTPDWAGKHPNLYGLYGATKELYRTIGKPAIETLGMVGGGIVGAGSGFLGGMGLGAIPGAAAGSALGYTGARQATEGIDRFFDLDRASRNPSLGQRAKSLAMDLSLGAIGTAPPSQRAIGPIRNQFLDSALLDSGLDKTLIPKLRPSEITQSKTLAQMESLLEQIPFSSDIMSNWTKENQLKPLIALRNKYLEAGLENTPRGEQLGQQIKSVIDKRLKEFDTSKTENVNLLRDSVLSKLGSKESYETLSKQAQNELAQNSAQAVSKKNQMYQALNEHIPEGELPFSNLQAEAQSQIDELSKLPNQDSKLINTLRWATDVKQNPEELALLESIKDYPEAVQKQILEKTGISKANNITKDWKTMQNFRNQLSEAIKNEDLAIKNGNPALKGQLSPEGARYKNLLQALDSDFETIAKDKGGEALAKYKEAQEFYKNEYAPVWKNKVTQQMGYKNPSELVDTAIKKGSTTEIDVARKALGDEAFNNTVKPAFTNKLLGAGRDETFNPDKLRKALNDYGEETLLRIYNKDELDMLKTLSETGRLVLEQEIPNKSLLKTLANNPQNILVDSILGASEKIPNSTTVLKNVTVINDMLTPQQREGLKIELLARIFRLGAQTGQVEAGTMAKNIDNHKRILEKLLSKEQIKGLEYLSLQGHLMTRAHQAAANPSGTAKNVIAWGLANQLIFNPIEPLMRGDVSESARRVSYGVVSSVLGPKVLAKLYLSPKGQELLIKGMSTKVGTKEGARLAKQLSIVLGNEYINDQQE